MRWSIQVLGSFEISHDGRDVLPTSPMTRRILALLVTELGQTVSRDRIIEAIWPTERPDDPVATLQVHMANLRKALGPSGRAAIVTESPGYRLAIDPSALDAQRFSEIVVRGVADLAEARWRSAAGHFESALDLWVGPEPFVGFEYEDFTSAARRHLADQRLNATEGLLYARSMSGQPIDIAIAERLVDDHPTRTRIWYALIVALASAGRQADALRAYDRAYAAWADRGLLIPTELRMLSENIAAGTLGVGVSGPALAPLPSYHTSVVGRDQAIAEVRDRLQRHRLLTIVGPAGVGKTRIAVEATQDLPRDRVAFVSLAPVTAADVAARVAQAVGLPQGPSEPHAIADGIGGAAIVLVLDNCEHVLDDAAALVECLISSSPNLRILATSRSAIRVDGEAVHQLEPLPVTGSDSPAVHLFLERLRATAPTFPIDGKLGEVETLVQYLDGLPLAIELAAAAAPVQGLERSSRALRAYRRSGPARQRSMEDAIGWSWSLLGEHLREFLSRLSLFNGPFTAEQAARLGEVDLDTARDYLVALTDASLLTVDYLRPAPYSLLRTIRAYGLRQLDLTGDRARAEARFATHLAVIAGEHEDSWQSLQEPDLRSALDTSLRVGASANALELATALARSWNGFGRPADAHDVIELVRRSIEPSTYPEPGWRFLDAAGDLYRQREPQTAAELWESAVPLAPGKKQKAILHNKIAEVLAQAVQGDTATAAAAAHIEAGLELLDGERGTEWVQLQLTRAGIGYWKFDADLQRTALREAERESRRLGDADLRAAVAHLRQAFKLQQARYAHDVFDANELEAFLESDLSPGTRANVLFALGFGEILAGRPEPALEHLASAEGITAIQGFASPRILGYRSIAHRMLQQVDELRDTNQRLLHNAQRAGYRMYEALGHANEAWLAADREAWAEARRAADLALEIWATLQPSYAFQWTALIPLLRSARHDGPPDAIRRIVDQLLAPSERRFPDDLHETLLAAQQAADPVQAAARILDVASRHGLT